MVLAYQQSRMFNQTQGYLQLATMNNDKYSLSRQMNLNLTTYLLAENTVNIVRERQRSKMGSSFIHLS